MRTELSKLQHELKTTAIYVTHDQTEAMTMGDRIVVMKDGIIQQVDDPLGLYNQPENMFVAGFIGSPAMNFLRVNLEREGNKYYFKEKSLSQEEFKIGIPEALLEEVSDIDNYVGEEVVFGIRPENLIDASLQGEFKITEDNSFKSKVKVVEPMGSEIYLYFDLEGDELIARVDADSEAKVGDIVKLGVDPKKMHMFDPKTEECLF